MFEEGMQIFVDEAAEYEARGHHIVSRWKGREYVMPIAVAEKAVMRLNRALTIWRAGGAEVVELSPRKHG